jgi:hypothetical protein
MQWADAINQHTHFKNAIEMQDLKMHKIKT